MPLKLTGATTGSLTIDASANGGDVIFSGDISDLTGVDFTTSASSGDLLSYNGTNWVPTTTPHTLTLAGLTGDVDMTTVAPANGNYMTFDGTNWVPASASTPTSIQGTMTGSIIPDTDDTYDIGSATYKVRDLYLGSTSLHIGDVDVSSNQRLNWSYSELVLPNVQMTGHMIPDTNDAYDIGSAEYKIRDMYVSDNSLWVGDDHKVSVEGGNMKFRKRKGTKQLPPVIDALVLADNPGTNSQERIAIVIAAINELFPSHTVTLLSHIRLRMWTAYLRTFAGHENGTIQDIFRNQDDDYEPNQIDTGTQDILVKQNGYVRRQKYMESTGLQDYPYLTTTFYNRGEIEEVGLPNNEDWFVTTIPSGTWSVVYTKKECTNYIFKEGNTTSDRDILRTEHTRIIDPTEAGYDASYPNRGTYSGSWMDETSCEAEKHTWDGSSCSIDLSLAPNMLATMDETKCLALSARKWSDIYIGDLPEVANHQGVDIRIYDDVQYPATPSSNLLDDMIQADPGQNKISHDIIIRDVQLNVPAQADGIWVNSSGGKEPILKRKVSKTAVASQQDIESINNVINNPMDTKNIWWIGTSIPETAGYVGKVEDILGAKIANVAVGASILRRGRAYPMSVYEANGHINFNEIFPDHHVWDSGASSCSDGVTGTEADCIAKPHDYILDIPWGGHTRSVLYSSAEKAEMWNNWDAYWDNLVHDKRRDAPWAPECIVNETLDASIKSEKACVDTTGGVWTQVTKCTDGTSGDLATCEAQDFIKTSDSSVSGTHKWLTGYHPNSWRDNMRTSIKTAYDLCLDPYLDKEIMGNDLPDIFVIDHGFNDRALDSSSDDWARYDPNNPNATNRNTFRGSMNWLINRIRASLPRVEIVIISHHNKAYSKEESIVTLQKEIAEDRCLPFLDLSSKMGLTTHQVPNTAHLWEVEPWKENKPNTSETGTCSESSITNQNTCVSSGHAWTYKDMTELRFNISDNVHPHKDRTWHIQNKIGHHCATFINENTNWKKDGGN